MTWKSCCEMSKSSCHCLRPGPHRKSHHSPRDEQRFRVLVLLRSQEHLGCDSPETGMSSTKTLDTHPPMVVGVPSPNDTAPLSHLSSRRRGRKGEQDLQQEQMTETEPEPWLVRIDVMQVVVIESHDRKQDPGDQVLWPQHGVSTAVPCWILVFPSKLSIGKSP